MNCKLCGIARDENYCWSCGPTDEDMARSGTDDNAGRVDALREALGDQFVYAVRTLQSDPRLADAHTVDIVVRKDGVERRLEADWLKALARLVQPTTTPSEFS